MLTTNTVTQCGCMRCDAPVPAQHVCQSYDPRTATHTLIAWCPRCESAAKLVRRTGGDWQLAHLTAAERRSLEVRLGQVCGDLKVGQANTLAAAKTLRMAAPPYERATAVRSGGLVDALTSGN